MTDIKCPVCGNENNETATECLYCGAILNASLNQTWRKTPPESMEDILASLRDVGGTSAEQAEAAVGTEMESGSDDAPQGATDFVHRLRNLTVEPDEFPGTTPDTTEENIPDWLRELNNWQQSSTGNTEAVESTAIPPEKQDDSIGEDNPPNWLDSDESDLQIDENEETDKAYPSQSMKEEVLADWLASQREGSQSPVETDAGEEVQQQIGNIIELPPAFEEQVASDHPDEIFSENSEVTENETIIQPDISASAVSGPEYPDDAESISAVEGEQLNEWLDDLQTADFPQVFDTSDETSTAPEPSNTTPPFVGGELTAWMELALQQADAAGETGESEKSTETSDALPHWMQNITPGGEENPETGSKPEGPAAPETGIPGWLAALQPLESELAEPTQPGDYAPVEEEGPLAGIPGVLPAFETSAFLRKPPLYSSQLQVTEKQLTNVAKLETMLTEEKQNQKKKRPIRKIPFGLIRTLIGILLIGVMLLPLLGFKSPALESMAGNAGIVGAASFHKAIIALPEEASVLVAMEFSPGFSGEINPSAKSTFELLMNRNAHLAIVSTNTSGPVLAEGIKNEVLKSIPGLQEQYSHRDWFINLGYLPGETLSLQELVSDPQQAVRYGISSGSENRLVWDSAGLINIQNLNDFSMLVLITDTGETARAWIEQVQPSIPDVPFLIVASAQAAPMVQPYLKSGQVQGLLSGMTGGLSLMNTENGDVRWTIFQVGVTAIIILILVGVVAELVTVLLGRKRLDQEVS